MDACALSNAVDELGFCHDYREAAVLMLPWGLLTPLQGFLCHCCSPGETACFMPLQGSLRSCKAFCAAVLVVLPFHAAATAGPSEVAFSMPLQGCLSSYRAFCAAALVVLPVDAVFMVGPCEAAFFNATARLFAPL